VTGTIDEVDVLRALDELAGWDVEHEGLYRDAAVRVRASRSAGVEALPTIRREAVPSGAITQLRYRSEMADIFNDLAIDVALSERRELADVGSNA
jgi:hypothetical protein